MLSKLLTLLGFIEPPFYDSVEQMEPGPCLVRGQLHSLTSLESPIGRQPCVAFWYQAWFSGIRGSGGAIKSLRNVVVYAPDLTLELGDGFVGLGTEPSSADAPEMTPAQHRRLDKSDIPGFKARERIIVDGDEVRVRGRARWSESEALWRLEDFAVLLGNDKPSETKPTSG